MDEMLRGKNNKYNQKYFFVFLKITWSFEIKEMKFGNQGYFSDDLTAKKVTYLQFHPSRLIWCKYHLMAE